MGDYDPLGDGLCINNPVLNTLNDCQLCIMLSK